MVSVAAWTEVPAGWLAHRRVSGAQRTGALSSGVCAHQSEALLGHEQRAGRRAGFGCRGSVGNAGCGIAEDDLVNRVPTQRGDIFSALNIRSQSAEPNSVGAVDNELHKAGRFGNCDLLT